MKISDYQRRELKNINFKSFFIEDDRIDSITQMAIKIADIAYPEHTLKIPILRTQKDELISILSAILLSVHFSAEEYVKQIQTNANKDLDKLRSNICQFVRTNQRLIYGIHPDMAKTFKDIEAARG